MSNRSLKSYFASKSVPNNKASSASSTIRVNGNMMVKLIESYEFN